jgi:hypothetical protein
MKININLGGITIILTALLCILKVVGILKMSWLWCFSLFWIPVALFIATLCLVVFITFIVSLVEIIFKF